MAKAAAQFIAPMKARRVGALPTDPPGSWHAEIKYDGYRAVAVIRGGEVELWSRNHKRLDYPEIVAPLGRLKCREAVLDGEVAALDSKGRSDFQLLQRRDLGDRPPIVYYLFDVMALDGRSLIQEPIEERRAALTKLLPKSLAPLKLSPEFDDPGGLLAAAKRHGLEGVILKRSGSRYEPDRRSGAWIKIKHVNEEEFVIGGFTPPKASRRYFGAILVGYREKHEWVYAGKVGTGFEVKALRDLHTTFLGLKTERCPFANLPLERRSRFGGGMTSAEMRSTTWIEPKLVAQIKFAEWTSGGQLRQPVFLGLRTDKTASSVHRESA